MVVMLQPGIDLSEQDLSGEVFTGDGTDAILFKINGQNANFNGTTSLVRTDFKEADLFSAEFVGTNLTNADLSKATLKEADFTNATLQNAILTEADVEGIIFDNTNATDADFTLTNSRMPPSPTLPLTVST